jgi:O-methyltransferase
LKRCLTFSLWDARDGSSHPDETPTLRKRAKQFLMGSRTEQLSPQVKRAEGRDWPVLAHTMVGLKRLDNLQCCIESVLANKVPGDLIETGVWRGGATILMRAVLKAHKVTDRLVWVADSFEGLPVPDPEKYPADSGDVHHTFKALAIGLETVKNNFRAYGLLDDQVRFLKGWFRDTLPSAPFKELAVVRLDGDLYESTMDGLVNLYPKLSPGGCIIIDDYGAVPGCKKAVDDYRESHAIKQEIVPIDWGGVYWRKA